MIRKTPTTNKIEKVPLPLPIATHHKQVSLSIDFFFVNGHAFLTSKSSKLNFVTATYLPFRRKGLIIETLNNIRNMYEARGFDISNFHGDNEFNKPDIIEAMLPTLFHAYVKDEHVGLIERSNRTTKEKVEL